MKKVILTTAALVLVGGGAAYAAIGGNSDKTTTEADATTKTHEEVKVADTSIDDFTEAKALSEVVDVDELNAEVVEDNDHKRVIVLKDSNGHPKAKSIFIKDDSRLKVIDFDKGKVFDDIIGDTADDAKADDTSKEKENNHKAEDRADKDNDNSSAEEETKKESKDENSDVEGMDEYKTIGEHVDVDKYDAKVVEDNSNKRIILLNDDHSKPEYKTIYIKDKKFLKIIDLNGGMVYKGTI
ncbi:MAG TPA: hypothetical protein VK111_05055 [Virgibacillus sp.]|nr:hypothetical protein [Virgibacillus sp.]